MNAPTTSASATPSALPSLVTVNEVAAALAISRSGLYNLIARGELRVIKIGSCVRLRAADVESFIAAREVRS